MTVHEVPNIPQKISSTVMIGKSSKTMGTSWPNPQDCALLGASISLAPLTLSDNKDQIP